jgi:hypothetical protein
MPSLSTRRRFLQTSATAAGLAVAPAWLRAAPPADRRAFSFVLLGDLHFDRPEHHDMAWVEKEKPNDISQINGYCRHSREVTPLLFATLRAAIADLNQSPATRVACVLQAGDLVEGLCGREELSVRQNREGIDFIAAARLGAPFLFTKGNHDITGPGAVAAFGSVFHPFLTAQARQLAPAAEPVTSARYTVECGHAQLVFFDAYEAAKSLEWFEAIAARRTAEHLFVIIHPPVVPYGARATWHIFSSAKETARREKLLTLLGNQGAIVLGGHIHRYSVVTRRAGRGRFRQFALSSVLPAPAAQPKTILAGLPSYTPDQITVEPGFSPANEAERRAVYVAERPFVDTFDYADLPGWAIVTVDGPQVTLQMFAGATRDLWRTVDLTART